MPFAPRHLITLALCLLLGACVSRPPATVAPLDWEERLQRYAALDDWRLQGRLGLRGEGRSGTATLIWDERRGSRSIRLLGPMGGGVVTLEQDAAGATLRDRRDETWQAATAQELIRDATGWDLPMDSLRWWLRGIVAPGSSDFHLDDRQRLVELLETGWRVEFSDYRPFGDYELPGRITMHRDRPDDDAQARLVIRRFEPGPGDRAAD